MSEKAVLKRLLVFVDGVERPNANDLAQSNPSNISRLKCLFQDGSYTNAEGRTFKQVSRYYNCPGSTQKLMGKFKSKVLSSNVEVDDVKTITKDICEILESSQDELCLYGSGNGAYIGRAVAGVLHHMGLPKRQARAQFDEAYDAVIALRKAQKEDDNRKGPRLVKTLESLCDKSPQIQFMGLFDTVRLTATKQGHDISMVPSVRNLRHALAINEARSSLTPEFMDVPSEFDQSQQSCVQAWFAGNHNDLVGGTEQDGLSLYPLQWMILESMRAGLTITVPETSATSPENPLAVVFPQFTGNLPTINSTEEIEWRLEFNNGIDVRMFDMQTTHFTSKMASNSDHAIHLDQDTSARGAGRKIFDGNSLIGWTLDGNYGTIVHPSLFCLLDRYPRIRESPRFKTIKDTLGEFQEQCMTSTESVLPPWLEGSELSASGVKAFRILVCGKTGVGKSTLINKVFGVEMTEESTTYDQGVHNINEAFESPSHPGLLVHDSRGWQAGSDKELDLIAKFLRHRAFQRDPSQALHVIWFCLDADVSRIEEADKKTFATISQFSHHVPVFVVGTKKDKILAMHKMKLLERYMESSDDFKEASRMANEEADKMANDQFDELRFQLSRIEHYKADGYCCISKDDDGGIKNLINQTLGLIADERVRLFCVAAQVVDVEQKIDSAITECMRLGTHAVRTSLVPLPFSGMIGTPTVSRLIVEHVMICFGFPKTTPDAVEEVMNRVVMGNLRSFLTMSLTQFMVAVVVGGGLAAPTFGATALVALFGSLFSAPPTSRMLLKCSCDMILILERAFRYGGKFVSIRQIEDAASYYTTTIVKSFGGKDKVIQQQVHDDVDSLIPLTKFKVGFTFNKLRGGIEEIIYNNRFDRTARIKSRQDSRKSPTAELENQSGKSIGGAIAELDSTTKPTLPAELEESANRFAELEGDTVATELPASPVSPRDNTTMMSSTTSRSMATASSDLNSSATMSSTSRSMPLSELDSRTSTTMTSDTEISELKSAITDSSIVKSPLVTEPDTSEMISADKETRVAEDMDPKQKRRSGSSWKSRFSLRKSKT